MEIHSFEKLYAFLAEALYHAGYGDTVKRHENRLFIIELELHYALRIHEAKRKDGRSVCLEILCHNRQIKQFHFHYADAYSFVMEKAVKCRRQTIKELEKRRIRKKRLLSCAAGAVLIPIPALLIFAVWLSRSSDFTTPLYVYLALTFAFGLLILCGIGIIWHAFYSTSDKKGSGRRHAETNITEIPLANISNIAASSIYFVDEALIAQGEYGCLVPAECAAAWYKRYHPQKAFSFIRQIRSRYIGNRVWRIGGTSYLSFYNGKKEIRFTIPVPTDTASENYRLAREKWEDITRRIQNAGWMLFDEM